MKELIDIKKACAFYVSDEHLSVMIIPYISKQIKNNNEVITFLENDLEKNIKIILSKLLLDEKEKEKIKKINWKKNNEGNIELIINNLLLQNTKINIFIKGSKKYIEKINYELKLVLKKHKEKHKEIIIIDCYDTENGEKYIKKIIEEHDIILNTAGLKNIEEIFEKKENKKCPII